MPFTLRAPAVHETGFPLPRNDGERAPSVRRGKRTRARCRLGDSGPASSPGEGALSDGPSGLSFPPLNGPERRVIPDAGDRKRGCSSDGLERWPVTPKVVGSSPITLASSLARILHEALLPTAQVVFGQRAVLRRLQFSRHVQSRARYLGMLEGPEDPQIRERIESNRDGSVQGRPPEVEIRARAAVIRSLVSG